MGKEIKEYPLECGGGPNKEKAEVVQVHVVQGRVYGTREFF